MKRYLPVLYVDEWGVLYTWEQLKTKKYKKDERTKETIKKPWGEYIQETQRIRDVRETAQQGKLF